MNIGNLLKIALKALANNRLRGFLTMLGVIIGVASVITMIAIGQGSKSSIQADINAMGSNMITIKPGAETRGGAMTDASTMQSLTMEDYEAIVNSTEYISYITPIVNTRGQVINGANNTLTSIYGANADYLDIRVLAVSDGVFFGEKEIRSAAKVCVIGSTVAENLFPDGENPIGKEIRFQKIPFQIIGVLESKGYNTMGMDQDDLIIAPYTTVQKRILAITHLQEIRCSATNEEMTDMAVAELTDILRQNHQLKEADEDDFNIRTQQELSSMLTSTTDLLTILLSAVAGISLLVGGIGIMNIMYVSVTERTREIGLRMSIGAKGRDILAQFLIESVLISITGGIIGVLLGLLATFVVSSVTSFPTEIQSWSILLSFAVCSFTGVFFGWYPAQKASMLDPIEAIRFE